MEKKNKTALLLFLLLDLALLAVAAYFVFRPEFNFGNFDLLTPKGVIAQKQLSLLVTVTLIMLCIVIPVFALLIYTVWKYRAGKNTASQPEAAAGSLKKEFLLWVGPAFIIFIISIINWKSTHELDPYRPIASANEPITIQVVALRWKWLFIYPKEKIATLNFIEFPENTPVVFELTADDAPMNSFWIPQLGGQMYAMAGMSTKLNLMANQTGEFKGSAADISGFGFAGMRFKAKSVTKAEFESWVKETKKLSAVLNSNTYTELAKPSENNQPAFFSHAEEGLYDTIVMKYMKPKQ
jgi:cytochrome o ubiquinol oxidase subunit 2